jgi:hypothetical protein
LLLEASFHDTVPWMNASFRARAYSRASIVCGLAMAARLFSSTTLPPKAHSSQWQNTLPSLGVLAKQKPIG